MTDPIQQLRDAAENRCITQLAKDAKVSRQSVYNLFSDSRNHRWDVVVKLAKALNMQIVVKKI